MLVIIWAVWLQIRQLRSQRASAALGAAIAEQPDAAGGKRDGGESEQLRARFDEAVKSLKFSDCLPRVMATRMLQRRCCDLPSLRAVLAEPIRRVVIGDEPSDRG